MTSPWRARIGRALPHLVIWPPVLICAAHVVGFTLWTTWISFTSATLLPDYSWAGLRNYSAVLASRNWTIAFDNLLIYGGCFVVLTTAVGLVLAILLDQRIRAENVLRTI